MPIRDLAPLDSEGIRLDRPVHEVKWAKLTNVMFRDGALVPRAGFKEAYNYSREIVESAAVEPAPASGLVELYNPGSSVTGRGGASWTGEILRPDGSASLVAGWTASASTLHGDTDEVVPDGNYAGTSTIGSKFYLTFANPVATYTDILGVRLYVRAKVEYTGVNDATGTIRVSQRVGASTYTIEDLEVWAYNVDETAFWYDYSLLIEKEQSTGRAWVDADLDSLQIAFEFLDATSGIDYYLAPTSIDSNTGWVDAEDGGAAVVADITLTREGEPAALPSTGYPPSVFTSPKRGNGLTANDANDVIQITFADIPAGTTFTTIDFVQIGFRAKTEPYTDVPYEIYYNNGSTDTLVTSGVANSSCKPYEVPISSRMTTNPQAGGAWTKTQVNASSWKFKIKDSKQITLQNAQLTVQGNTNSATVRIDTVSAEVIAPGTTAPPDKLVLSNRSFLRYQPEDRTIDDVTNSVPSQSVPSIAPFDWAILYGQVYVTNGVDPTKRYPTAGLVFESLTTNNADGATPITGRTVCAFADRILYGWVRDNTTYTPERVAYSKEFNGGTHNDASAGDFDIIDSMGGIVALRPLNESLCFCGKERGIYALRRTGNSAFPIIVDPIDYETGCLSMWSAVRVLLKGQPAIMFYGHNPTSGLNVFVFDGSTVRPIGDAINPLLEELANPWMNTLAVAGIDPRTNSYVLFLAPGRGIERSVMLSMNLNSGAWTRGDLPYAIYSAAQWSMPSETVLTYINGGTTLGGEAFPGLPTMVLGGRNNLALRAHDLPYDTLTPHQNAGQLAADDVPGHIFEVNPRSAQKAMFTSTIETGDIQLLDPNAGELQMVSYRLHMDYVNYGPVRLGVSTSIDGGLTFSDETIVFIGTMDKDGGTYHTFLDMEDPVNDRRVRFRIRVLPESATWDLPFYWKIDRIFIEYTVGGIDGP